MRWIIFTFLAVVGTCLADDFKLPSTLTVNGVTYTDCVLQSKNAATISFVHANGLARVPITSLSPELQRALNYDPKTAAVVFEKEKADREATAKAMAEAAQKREAKRLAEKEAASATEMHARVAQVLEDGMLVVWLYKPTIIGNSIGNGGRTGISWELGEQSAFFQGAKPGHAEGDYIIVFATNAGTLTRDTVLGAERTLHLYKIAREE